MKFISLLFVVSLIACQNPGKTERQDILENKENPNAPQIEQLVETEVVPASNYKGISIDLLSQLLKKKNEEITVALFNLDQNWEFYGKSKSGGDIWDNRKYDQQVLKISNETIVYFDYSNNYLDNFNLLKTQGTDQHEIQDLGVITFNYKKRFIQWKELNENGKKGSILEFNDWGEFDK